MKSTPSLALGILVLATLPSMASTSTEITVAGLPSNGLELISSADPEFQALLVKDFTSGIPPEVTPLLPFSVFIRNANEKRVIAYTVRWAKTDVSGKTIFHDQTTWNLISLRGGDALEAQSDRFVSPIFNAHRMPPDVLSASRERFRRTTLELGRQKAVAISLDAAVFDDGTTIGPDLSQTAVRVDARLAAEKDLFGEVIARYNAGHGDLKSFLTSMTQEPTRGDRSNPSQYWYSIFKARTAAGLLHTMGVRGNSGALAYIKTTLHDKPYPVIHRISE